MQVELMDKMGSDLTVVNAARVSFNKEVERFTERDDRLIQYLARHGHWSPFAHCILQFRITAPIFVARQLYRHQVGLAVNEVSRRYVDDALEFHKPCLWRTRAADKKQGSGGSISETQQSVADTQWSVVHDVAEVAYQKLLELGVAPEQARMVLPQSTMTTWWWTGSLFAFARICRERLAPDAQGETREVAHGIDFHCRLHFPFSWAALMEEVA